MKTNKMKVLALSLSLIGAVTLTGCDNKLTRWFSKTFGEGGVIYQADTKFMYSLDGGTSWSQTIQEIPVDTTYYLAVEMQVTQSEETKDEKKVVATITIPQPKTDVLDCQLDDYPGVSITGTEDAAAETISYDFDVIAGVTPHKFRVVFECKAREEGKTKVEVVYDDSVDSSWDQTGSIKYVASEKDSSSKGGDSNE